MTTTPLVSVVTPTRNRPQLVLRAIATALVQTYKNLEVVVVVDGPDELTVKVLREVDDERIRVLTLPENVGGSEARNIGVRASNGDWIAFLDDDDEWLPEKIEKQMSAINELADKNAFLSCKFVERSINESRTYPVRLPDPGERIDCYMCCPRSLRSGGELIQTSTLLVPRSLAIAVPFVKDLKRGQDFIWLIEAGTRGGAAFYVLPEALSYLNSDGFTDETRVSSKPNWRSFYKCVQEKRQLFNPRAYRYCIATRILTDAIACNEPFHVKIGLLKDCLSDGIISFKCAVLFLYIWILPPIARRRLGATLRSFQRVDGAHNPRTAEV